MPGQCVARICVPELRTDSEFKESMFVDWPTDRSFLGNGGGYS